MDPKPKTVGIYAYRDVQLSAVHGLNDLFLTANKIAKKALISPPQFIVHIWSSERDLPVGLRCLDAFIIPPSLSEDIATLSFPTLNKWVRNQHELGTLICSVCAGAYLLAKTGLCDGRTITTHWAIEPKFKSLFPRIITDASRLIIDDGDILTAGGVMAWVDLGLRLIERLMSPQIMVETAKFFIVDPATREQKPYQSFFPILNHGDPDILRVQHWIQSEHSKKIDVRSLAKVAGMSERTLIRKFKKNTGLNPLEYIQQLRIGKAKELLEFSNHSIEEIGWKVGYEDSSAFRKIFLRISGLNPGAYRTHFQIVCP